ncbi:MAG TPA: glycosyltransferase [Opitutaceae bacterium]|nr:glycosyltransferase [Opitutaceae bacterium]
MRRIAMISTHGYVAANPPLGAADTGGQVVYVLELSKKFAALGYEVDIWTRQFADQPATEEVAPGVTLRRAPCGGPEFIRKEDLYRCIPEWCEHALRLIRDESLSYTFINSHYWDAGLAGQHLADVLDTPHLHTPHSLGSWKKKQMAEGASAVDLAGYNFDVRIREETAIYAAADMVIATTPEQMDILAADYDVPAERMKMVPPGYDDARFFPVSESTRQSIRRRLGFRGPTVLALGRLARNKGYDLLLRAFAVTAARVPDARLHLAIGGESLNEREQSILAELKTITAELRLEPKIVFGGFIPDAELPDYYRAADQFVLCSRYEPFGMTAIEAMASGCPTTLTVHGGLFRAVTYGRHALFADPFDAEDLGITMMKPFKHPRLRARLARMGAHKARSLFTWTGIAQQIAAQAESRSTPAFSLADHEWDEPWNDSD